MAVLLLTAQPLLDFKEQCTDEELRGILPTQKEDWFPCSKQTISSEPRFLGKLNCWSCLHAWGQQWLSHFWNGKRVIGRWHLIYPPVCTLINTGVHAEGQLFVLLQGVCNTTHPLMGTTWFGAARITSEWSDGRYINLYQANFYTFHIFCEPIGSYSVYEYEWVLFQKASKEGPFLRHV